MNLKSRLKSLKILVVIPTYNNGGTLADVITQVREQADDVLVVNDGSTDCTDSILEMLNVNHISYKPNRGKGYAIQQAFKYAQEQGFDYIITIDSDGQHYVSDLPQFVEKIEQEPHSLIIGARNLRMDNMPSKNTFANKFSNFWYHVETGHKLDDTQSGFRLYPIQKIANTHYFSNRYEFEVEVIVRAAWKGVNVCNIPIKVYYPPVEERVSHFKPLKDFTRISILNTFLVTIALLFYYPWRFMKSLTKENLKLFIQKNITQNPDSNLRIASAIGMGFFFGIFPIWGYQMIVAAALAHILKLNKVITLVSSNISIPPCMPFIIYGSYYIGARLFGYSGNIDFEHISIEKASQDILQYICGASLLAVLAAIVGFMISFLILHIFRKKSNG